MNEPAWFNSLSDRAPLQSWIQKFIDSELFAAVMSQQVEPWRPGQPAVWLERGND